METKSASFETPGHVLLSLRVPQGSISLTTADAPQTEVALRVHGDGDAAHQFLEDCRLELREADGRYEVRVEVPKRRGLGVFQRDPEIELLVTAPHGADVSVDTRSADVEGRGRFGAVDVHDVSGDVRFDEIDEGATIRTTSGDVRVDLAGGPVDVNTTSGDVELGSVQGRAGVRAVSGDVRIRHAAESVEVTSVSGDQTLEGVVQGDVALQSVSGDVVVAIRRGSRVWVDAKSLSGDTVSELDLSEHDEPDDDGAPLVELRVNTVSGDVRVTRAGATVR